MAIEDPRTPELHAPSSAPASGDIFVRNATGLVRDVSTKMQTLIAFNPGAVLVACGAGVLFSLSLYPGGSIPLAVILTVPLLAGLAYSSGLMTAAFPRTGGDYMIVSRVLHPAAGLISSFFQTLADILSLGFFGITFVLTGLAPTLIAVGTLGNNSDLVSAGNTLLTDLNWQFALGAVAIILAGSILLFGWRLHQRIVVGLCFVGLGGLVLAVLISLLTSPCGFEHDFNSTVASVTGEQNSYQHVISAAQKNGIQTSPSFSLDQTLPYVGVLGGLAIFMYFGSMIGGELRQGRSTGTAHRMFAGGMLNLLVVLGAILVFFHTFGSDFLTAAFGYGMPAGIDAPPFYFFLVGVATSSPAVSALLGLSYMCGLILVLWITFLQPTRHMFAYGFDGILPRSVIRVSSSGVPWLTVVITAILGILVQFWVIHAGDNVFKVLVYAILLQITSMGLVGLAAVVFPWRRPELFRASVSNRRWGGIPVVSIAGVGGIAAVVAFYLLYIHYPGLGLSSFGDYLVWVVVVIASALVYYAAAWSIQRARGVDLGRVYREIPPE